MGVQIRVINEVALKIDPKKLENLAAKYGGDVRKALEAEYGYSDTTINDIDDRGNFNVTTASFKNKKIKTNKMLLDLDGRFVRDSTMKNLQPDADGLLVTALTVNDKGTVSVVSKGASSAAVTSVEPKVTVKSTVTPQVGKGTPSISTAPKSDFKDDKPVGTAPISDRNLAVIRKKNSSVKVKLYREIAEYIATLLGIGGADWEYDSEIVVNTKNEILFIKVRITDDTDYSDKNKDEAEVQKELVDKFKRKSSDIKMTATGIDDLGRFYVEGELRSAFAVQKVADKFKLYEEFGIKFASYIFESGYIDNIVVITQDDIILRECFHDIEDYVDAFETKYSPAKKGYECFFGFNEGVRKEDIKDSRILTLEDKGCLIGYALLNGQEEVNKISILCESAIRELK